MNVLQRVTAFFDSPPFKNTVGIVAVSGGPDSTLLTHVCHRLVQNGILAGIHLAHINHQLRAQDSDDDETFVRQLGERLGVATHVERRATKENAAAQRENLENQARNDRYQWFEALARQVGATWSATGHTADDQAETVLHHILRGSGVQGWAGIAPVRSLGDGVALLRPLLEVRRDEVLSCLAEWAESYRVDSSNEDRRFTRNRIRHDVLPRLAAEFNPRLVEVLCRVARQCGELSAYFAAPVAELLQRAERPRAGAMIVLDCDVLGAADVLLAREAFRLLWQREGWPMSDMTYDDWDHLARLARAAEGRHDFPGPIRARRVRNILQLSTEQDGVSPSRPPGGRL